MKLCSLLTLTLVGLLLLLTGCADLFNKTFTANSPVFSVPEGNFSSSMEVTITSALDGATIKYTTDGSDPSESGTEGTSVILTETTTLKAVSEKEGYLASGVTTAVYTYAPPTLFMAGHYTDANLTACYWVDSDANGSADATHDLNSSGNSTKALAIATDGTNVFAAGNNESTDRGLYWKDADADGSGIIETVLHDDNTSYAEDICYDDGAVYIVGSYRSGTDMIIAYWIDSNADGVIDSTVDCYANTSTLTPGGKSIYVKNNTVYVVGISYEAPNHIPRLWIDNGANGIDMTTDLASFEDGNMNKKFSIHATNTDLYIAGNIANIASTLEAAYWRDTGMDGTIDESADYGFGTYDTVASGITVIDNTVYLGGYLDNSGTIPSYWTDGTRTDLDITRAFTPDYAEVQCVVSNGSDLYLGGFYQTTYAAIWIKTLTDSVPVKYEIASPGSGDSVTDMVFVLP
jgi:hypothetical protein